MQTIYKGLYKSKRTGNKDFGIGECWNCLGNFNKRAKIDNYCSGDCKESYNSAPQIDLSHLTKQKKGAISELLTCVDLLKRGYDVFRAQATSSHADLTGIKNGIVTQFEVKTGFYYRIDGILSVRVGKVYDIREKVHVVVTIVDNKVHYINFNPDTQVKGEPIGYVANIQPQEGRENVQERES